MFLNLELLRIAGNKLQDLNGYLEGSESHAPGKIFCLETLQILDISDTNVTTLNCVVSYRLFHRTLITYE